MKKNTKPELLTTGAQISRKTIQLGLGHVARIEITYDGPNKAAPETGTEWPVDHDWPSAELKLTIPYQKDGRYAYLPGELRLDTQLLNENLGQSWGQSEVVTSDEGTPQEKTITAGRYKTARRAGASLRKLAADLLREAVNQLRPVQAHLKAREARLTSREATLLAGMDTKELAAKS